MCREEGPVLGADWGVDGGDLEAWRLAAERVENRPLGRARARERSLAGGAAAGEGRLKNGIFGLGSEARMCVLPLILQGETDFGGFPHEGDDKKN